MSRSTLLAVLYGAMHLVVDATTVSVVLSCEWLHALDWNEAFLLVLAYDTLAFASQTFVGLAVDRVWLPRGALVAGLVLCAAAVAALPVEPITAMLLASAGNALFHVGGGAITLWLSQGRAAPNGFFVAPGAIGLGLGIFVGRGGHFVAWPFLLALALSIGLAIFVAPRPHHLRRPPPRSEPEPPGAPASLARGPRALALGLLLASIAVRSFAGYAGTQQGPSTPEIALALTLAAFGGKALGGLASDRFGWARASVAALVLAAPLLAWGSSLAPALVLGVLLVQTTMPVTLSAIYVALPERPALAFGIASTAFVLGVLPAFAAGAPSFFAPALIVPLVLGSALAIFVSLRILGSAHARPGETTASG